MACWFFSGECGRSSSASRGHFQCLFMDNIVFWHCSPRSSGLPRIILQGTVKEGRRQSRQKKTWEDNIGNRQAWSSPYPRGQWRTEKSGGNWFWKQLWCPKDPRGYGIDDDDDDHEQFTPLCREYGIDDDDDDDDEQFTPLCTVRLLLPPQLAGTIDVTEWTKTQSTQLISFPMTRVISAKARLQRTSAHPQAHTHTRRHRDNTTRKHTHA